MQEHCRLTFCSDSKSFDFFLRCSSKEERATLCAKARARMTRPVTKPDTSPWNRYLVSFTRTGQAVARLASVERTSLFG